MPPFLILIPLAAAVMLLPWAVRMVRTGDGVLGMACAGTLVAIILQCATALGILAAGFATSGLISTCNWQASRLVSRRSERSSPHPFCCKRPTKPG